MTTTANPNQTVTEPATDPVNYIKFQVPGLPYSVVSVPLTEAWIDFAVDMAKHLSEKYAEAFPQEPPPYEREAGDPGPRETERVADPEDNRVRPPQGAQQAPQRQQGASNPYGVTLRCPEHGDILRPSVKNKNMDYIE